MLPLRRALVAAKPSTRYASRSTVPCAATWRTRTTAIKTYSTVAEEKAPTEEATPVLPIETSEGQRPAETTDTPSEDKPSTNTTSEAPSSTPAAPRKWSFAELAAERKALRAQAAEETKTKPTTKANNAQAARRVAASRASAAKGPATTPKAAAAAPSTVSETSTDTPTKATKAQNTSNGRPIVQATLRDGLLPSLAKQTQHRGSNNKTTTNSTLSEVDWQTSYRGISERPVYQEAADVLLRPLAEEDVEVKPDGIIYLPEIKYRRKLTEAFGPMGWGLIPRGEPVVGDNIVTREYCLIVDGRFVAQAQGENQYFGNDQLPSAVEGCKSNALMRCCKDIGVASELWDPAYIRWFRKNHMESRWVENTVNKKKKQFWFKKGIVEVPYPWKVTK